MFHCRFSHFFFIFNRNYNTIACPIIGTILEEAQATQKKQAVEKLAYGEKKNYEVSYK